LTMTNYYAGQRIDKPWGYEVILALTNRFCIKLLHVNKGQALSLQKHLRKNEALVAVDNTFICNIYSRDYGIMPWGSISIPANTVHRIRANFDCNIIEVSSPELDDVVRLEDNYGRV